MLFYPAEEIQARMSGGGVTRPWQIEIGAPAMAGAMSGISLSYWPTLISVALMLVALGLTVQAHRRSAELAEMQTDFVAHVSHQLKTPLSLLSAATETLQMDRVRSPEKLSEYLDTIHAEAGRLSHLVQRVLEFSRMQQDRRYELEDVDFGALTRETVDAFALDYWQVFAHIRWAVIALQQRERHRSGVEPSLELALTGHILSDLEHEILALTQTPQ
jgi:signal transduction histidine kinase